MKYDPPPFWDGPSLVRMITGTIRSGKDFMAISEGGEGTGKSTTTANLVEPISEALGRSFDLERDTIFTLDHLLDVMAEGQNQRVYVIDEGINIFHNQDWASWEAKALTKILRQMRIMQSAWFINVPDFEGLHPYIRDYRARLRLYHKPYWTPDGLGNQPAMILWKQEAFDFKEQRVTTHWHHPDLHLEADCIDDRIDHAAYTNKKEENFLAQVQDMQERRAKERRKNKLRPQPGRVKTPPTTS